jgi:hypothetical protein
MTFATPLWRHKMTFTLGVDGEVACFNIHTRYAGSESEPTVTSQLCHHVSSKWNTPFGPLKPMFGPSVKLVKLDTYSIDAAGHALTKATALFDGSDQPTWQGTDTGSSLPWENSLVVSLNANTSAFDPHAARKRGRFYLPPPASQILSTGGTGLVIPAKIDLLQVAAQAWLEAINDIPSGLAGQCRVVVASKAASANYDVRTVSMDSRMDAQRRRENRQSGAYVKSGVLDA